MTTQLCGCPDLRQHMLCEAHRGDLEHYLANALRESAAFGKMRGPKRIATAKHLTAMFSEWLGGNE